MGRNDKKTDVGANHVDIIIVGAGISGLGAAYELKAQCPQKSFVVLEAMEDFGGTWRCHKYPGVRSDSDLFTFGYRFKPWEGDPIASGEQILDYLGEVIEENDLADHIRYDAHIESAEWDSGTNRWTLAVRDKKTGNRHHQTCSFLWMCQGYYRHGEGYTPDWEGMETFDGQFVHPQTWPEDLDYTDKRVVIIGSGATAATLVPALAGKCEHVTMLQRSPTYFSPGLNKNKLADTLREIGTDPEVVHEIVRKRIVFEGRRYLQHTLDNPEAAKDELLASLAKHLPQDVIDAHFTPTYRPWQQRIAVVPDADLFKCVAANTASVVTDHIDHFTNQGIVLRSGKVLEADIVVTATGFSLCVFGDISFSVDGRSVDFSQTVTYRGMMFTGIPNMAWIMGYFRAASWTLRVDLVADFVCRLLGYMDEHRLRKVEVVLPEVDRSMDLLPWIDDELFNPGYMMRGQHALPRRGASPEWGHSQDYWSDLEEYPQIDLGAEPFRFDAPPVSSTRGSSVNQVAKGV